MRSRFLVSVSFLGAATVIGSILLLNNFNPDFRLRRPNPNGRSLTAVTRTWKRPYNVLSLGGSVTWGANLPSRELAYPALLRNLRTDVAVSDNIALRGTDSMVPSICLQTLIRELQESEGRDYEVEYDIIILEFTLNGVTNLDLLMKRLRLRYPDALIIYVDLYSNKKPGNTNCFGPMCFMDFSDREKTTTGVVRKYGGYFITMPRPSDPLHFFGVKRWFSNDDHHLGEEGHRWVYDAVVEKVTAIEDVIPDVMTLGDWLSGDTCYHWYTDGLARPGLEMEGGSMTYFTPTKFVYEIKTGETAKISFEQKSGLGQQTPVLITYMTKGYPSKYPKVRIGEKGILDPENKKWWDYHVTKSEKVGFTSGTHLPNTLTLSPIEKTEYPFRMIGISMCPACVELGMFEGWN